MTDKKVYVVIILMYSILILTLLNYTMAMIAVDIVHTLFAMFGAWNFGLWLSGAVGKRNANN